MSRWESALNQSAAGQSRVMMVTMVDLEIPGDRLRAHDGIGTITWDGASWLGLGKYRSIDSIVESTEVFAAPVEMTLSGLDASLISSSMTSADHTTSPITTSYHGSPARVYVALFNPDTDVLVDEPELIWDGHMDVMTIEVDQGTAVLRVKCEHRLRRMPSTSRYTNEDQNVLYPGNQFFSRLHQIPGYNATWGTGVADLRSFTDQIFRSVSKKGVFG